MDTLRILKISRNQVGETPEMGKFRDKHYNLITKLN